ncbi:hypothetical protein KOR42_50410 [Thalassoglobus neptunius]|uniref:TRASH domain-containing protein n=1 Tax=Thalassoglobus neptunius TaxID=1938619 RepID=A0A5C5VQH8_9PLAN|nr:hypothetical protein [Thalassoglobus neptunius]TWT39919.1 hypothetical protein KOR42_50410 [Thalassoglobus neptunius]
MKHFSIVMIGGFALLIGTVFLEAQEKKEVSPVCPVSGKDIDKTHSLKHLEANVYFCCPNCPKAFEANTEKFAPKANHQVVVTKQAKQVKCPISGQPLNPEMATPVSDVKVEFCCDKCLAKVKAAEGEKQLQLVFSDAAFQKGFEVKKAE